MEEKRSNVIAELTKKTDRIIKDRPSHKEVLGFIEEVITEQCRVKSTLRTVPVKGVRERAKEMSEGFPLLEKRELCPDIASATKLFKRLCRVLSSKQPSSLEAKWLNQALRRKEIDFAEFFEAVGAQDGQYFSTLSEKLKVKEELLLFLAKNSLKPILETYTDDLRETVHQEQWWRNYCPICGSPPSLARLRGEGERFLVCSLCSFEWRFPRLMCPFCGNEDSKGLRYFHTEKEGSVNRVDVCEKCKSYIKTVDTRGSKEDFIPLVEDMGSLYLDLLAQKKGYERGVQTQEQKG
ncbi:MAG: formate dehydrogenase accessory protein FdhE [Deltaproteobacteria bacterium]